MPVASLDLGAARVVDLDERKEFRPGLRSFGVGTPGLKAGYFKTFGGQRSFVLLTDRRRVLLLPERSGRHLLLSVEKPHALLDALRAAQRRRRLASMAFGHSDPEAPCACRKQELDPVAQNGRLGRSVNALPSLR